MDNKINMFCDFHNDVLSNKNYKRIINNYKKNNKIIVVCAAFQGKKSFNEINNLVKYFNLFKGENLYLSYECFDYSYKQAEILLSYMPKTVSLTWNYENSLGGGSLSGGGLTKKGKDFIKMLNERNIPLDVSHLSHDAFFEASELANKIVATHSAVNSIFSHKRNQTDEEILIIKQHNGLLGVTFYNPFLSDIKNVKPIILARHIEKAVNLIGIEKVCLGSDFYGCNEFPEGIKNYKTLSKLKIELQKMGFTNIEINKIFYLNLKMFLEKSDI